MIRYCQLPVRIIIINPTNYSVMFGLLSDAEHNFVEKHMHVNTPIGVVVKMSFSEPVPPGWRRLTIDEGR